MAADPPPLKNEFPAKEPKPTIVYERCVVRQIRFLDAKMSKLELQLNSELEKISSCSGLLEEIIAQPPSSPCASLRAEMSRVRAKRERAYQKFQRQQLELEMEMHGGAANPPDSAASAAGSN